MSDRRPFAVVEAWVDAVNDRDIERVVELSTPDIELGGPRGAGRGRQLLREWFGRARIELEPTRAFVRERSVIVAQRGVWYSMETGAIEGERDIASWFQVEGERVARFMRYESLDEALERSNLDVLDEISID